MKPKSENGSWQLYRPKFHLLLLPLPEPQSNPNISIVLVESKCEQKAWNTNTGRLGTFLYRIFVALRMMVRLETPQQRHAVARLALQRPVAEQPVHELLFLLERHFGGDFGNSVSLGGKM